MSGYGDTDRNRGVEFPDILQKADIAWLEVNACNPYMYKLLKDEHFCAGSQTKLRRFF